MRVEAAKPFRTEVFADENRNNNIIVNFFLQTVDFHKNTRIRGVKGEGWYRRKIIVTGKPLV